MTAKHIYAKAHGLRTPNEGKKSKKSEILGRCTLIWNAQYCPANNTIQANPYKNRGSVYPVDPDFFSEICYIFENSI